MKKPTPPGGSSGHQAKTAHINLRLAPDLHQVLKKMADDDDRTVSYVIRRILKDQLMQNK